MTRNLFYILAVVALAVMTGCSKTESPQSDHAEEPATDTAAHAHSEIGPHDGHLLELGDAYHAEFVVDHDTHTVTIYLTDGEVKELPEIDATAVTLSLFKDGEFIDYAFQAGDSPGLFSLADDALCHMLDHSEEVKGRLKAIIGGTEVVAPYEHDPHGDEDPHEHE